MIAKRLMLVYTAVVVLAYAVASWQGWSFGSSDRVQNVPKTVRENPGVYRAHYAGRPFHYGGK